MPGIVCLQAFHLALDIAPPEVFNPFQYTDAKVFSPSKKALGKIRGSCGFNQFWCSTKKAQGEQLVVHENSVLWNALEQVGWADRLDAEGRLPASFLSSTAVAETGKPATRLQSKTAPSMCRRSLGNKQQSVN